MTSNSKYPSRPNPSLHDITISEDNIALASFNQSCLEQTTLTIVDCNEKTRETQQQRTQHKAMINLPKIAAKQIS